MKISQKGLALIREFEGLRLKSYLDSVGVPTIGYGHTKNVKLGMVCTTQQAEAWLLEDVETFEKLVNQNVKVPLTQGQFDALVSIVFNVGPGGRHKSGIIKLTDGQPSTLLRKLNAKDYAGAADAFLSWKYAGGKVLAGLERRRAAERRLFLEG